MMKKYIQVISLIIIVVVSSISYTFAQANYAWIAEFDNNYSTSRTFNDGATGATIRSLTIQSTSNTDEYVIEWNSFNDKWQNGASPINTEFILFHGGSGNPNGVVSSGTTTGNYYTFQIDGLSYTNRNAVIMETSGIPVDISTVTSSIVAPIEDEVITVTLSGAKSPEERVFIRYSDNGFSSSEVTEVAFATTTASTGTATIPGIYNTPGKFVSYYAYSTTVAATSSSNHDLITLRLGNNGGANYSYTVENNWETINNGNFSVATTWRANSVPPANQNLVIASDINIDQDVEANSIICQSGNDLSVNSGSKLTISSGDAIPLGITGSGSLTINGTLSISDGGFTDIVPTYNAGSNLEYIDIIGSYQRFNEWTDTVLLGFGTPDNVIIDNAELDLSNGTQAGLVDFNINSNLTIQNSGGLTIDATESLTVGGNFNNTGGSLILNSISDNYSSLIITGTSSGNIAYNRHVNNAAASGTTTNANDLISPPVSGMTFGALRMANSNILSGTIGTDPTILYLFGPYDNSSFNNYVLFEETVDDGTVLDTGIGYRTGSTDGGTYTFTGGVETGTITEPITTPSGGSIWNLIGNPYPSYITLAEFLSINNGEFEPSSSGVYGYDGAATDGWTIWNNTTLFTNPNAVIAPGQGFFVASKSGGGSVDFNPNMRINGTSDDFIPSRESSVVTNIKLNLATTTDNFDTDIFFTEFTTLGLDPGYDASLFGGSAPAFSIYTHLVEENNGIPFAIQALGETDYGNTTIALGVNASQGEQLTFNLSTNTLPATVSVFLEDNVANTSTLLNTNDYVLTPAVNLNGTGRFYLNFIDSNLSTLQNNFDDLSIYTDLQNKAIVVSGEVLSNTLAKVYDIQGRLVTSKSLNSSERLNTIDVAPLQTGVYIVKVSDGNGVKSQKVILN